MYHFCRIIGRKYRVSGYQYIGSGIYQKFTCLQIDTAIDFYQCI